MLEGAPGQVEYQDLPGYPDTVDRISRLDLPAAFSRLTSAHWGNLPFLSPDCVMLALK